MIPRAIGLNRHPIFPNVGLIMGVRECYPYENRIDAPMFSVLSLAKCLVLACFRTGDITGYTVYIFTGLVLGGFRDLERYPYLYVVF